MGDKSHEKIFSVFLFGSWRIKHIVQQHSQMTKPIGSYIRLASPVTSTTSPIKNNPLCALASMVLEGK